jgi:hypothetical protein
LLACIQVGQALPAKPRHKKHSIARHKLLKTMAAAYGEGLIVSKIWLKTS